MAKNRGFLFNVVLFAISWASSFGQVRFLPPVTYPVVSPAIADLNGDGRPDMVAVHYENLVTLIPTVATLLGNGDGTFQAAKISSLGGFAYPTSLAVADLNEDGKPDLLVAILCVPSSDCRGLVGVMLGNGDGTFQEPVTYLSGGMSSYSVAVSDLNGDGKLDVIVTSSFAPANGDRGVVSILRGNGDGTLQAAQSYDSGGFEAGTVDIADANADGIADLLVVNGCIGTNDCNSGGTVG